jgi:hypothetical protein
VCNQFDTQAELNDTCVSPLLASVRVALLTHLEVASEAIEKGRYAMNKNLCELMMIN